MAVTIDDFVLVEKSEDVHDGILIYLRCKYDVKDLEPVARVLKWTIQRKKQCKPIDICQPIQYRRTFTNYA